jgi:hypothetical protein
MGPPCNEGKGGRGAAAMAKREASKLNRLGNSGEYALLLHGLSCQFFASKASKPTIPLRWRQLAVAVHHIDKVLH